MEEVSDLKNEDLLAEFAQKLPSEPADTLSVETNNSNNSQADFEGKNNSNNSQVDFEGKNNSNNVHLEVENSAEVPKSSGDHQKLPVKASGDARTKKVSESSEKTSSSGERRARPPTPQRVVTSRPPTPTRKFDEKYALIRERRKANVVKIGL